MLRFITAVFLGSIILFPAPADEGGLSLTFVGDIMAHNVNYLMKDYSDIYKDVKEYFLHDDLSFGNLEFPVVQDLPLSTYPQFNVHRNYVRAAIDAGFDVFSLANNHTRDRGEEEVLKTLASLVVLKEERKGGIYYSGIRGNVTRPFAPVMIRRNGFRIGFLAATQFLNIAQKQPRINVVDYRNKKETAAFLKWIASIAPHYDLFVFSYHGDEEFKLKPNPVKQNFFRDLVRAGVHIVWGHHPHVIEPYETITVNGHRRLIMYSMGNFISGMAYPYPPTRPEAIRSYVGDGMILPVRAVWGRDGDADVIPGEPVFIAAYREPDNDVVVRKLETLAASELPGKWQSYYQKRLAINKKFIKEMPSYLNKEPAAPGRTAE